MPNHVIQALLAATLAAAPASTPPGARPAVKPSSWSFSARADPVVFALLGFSAGVDGAPRDAPWRLSVAAFHVVVPDLIAPLVVHPADGVTVTEDAIQLGAFYDVDDRHRGWFFGPELYVYALAYEARGRRAIAQEAYAHLSAGYTWFPLAADPGCGFFLQPWATLGAPIFHTGGAELGGRHLEDRAVNWHATVSVGVRFP